MIERVRLATRPAPEPDDEPQEAPVRRRKPVLRRFPLRLDRNLMNHPIARDRRAKLRWCREGDSWVAALPGNDRVRVILPAEARARRAPTAVDVGVLLAIIAEAQRAGAGRDEDGAWRFRAVTRVKFASAATLIQRAGLDVRHRHRVALRDSLRFWTNASLLFARWYDGRGRDGDAVHIERVLPPPILRATRRGNALTITIDRSWAKLAAVRGYYQTISLPLPATAAAQNLALLISTSATRQTDDDVELGFRRRLSAVNYKIGVLHGDRHRTLDHAIGQVEDWYRAAGGEIVIRWRIVEDDLIFGIGAKARTPRNTAKKRGPQSGRRSSKRGPLTGRKEGHNPDAKRATNRTLL